ncbi:hypothetical protein TDB9533_01591 [Thalassocella blandensis]|nr:hypothetical protein TDB9533_01591 [Thalassocella blandensis]
MTKLNAKNIIRHLQLEAHVEGGYYRRTFQSDHRSTVETAQGQRYCSTSIYYMLTKDSPLGKWHFNHSDILHYFHSGNPIEYSLILPDGSLQTCIVGPNILAGQQYQLVVKGGSWKCSRLLKGTQDYALISEAVSPGFDYSDMRMANVEQMSRQFPQHAEFIKQAQKP